MTVASAAGRPECIENQIGKSRGDDNNYGTKTKKKIGNKKTNLRRMARCGT